MAQFDFGTIDPFVMNGEQLAEALNDWRDALHSLHRGVARPSYVVEGMLWVDDSAGATDWQVKVYLGATPGDKILFHYNTSTGDVTTGEVGITSNPLLAQAAADPEVAWWNTGNAADAKRWSALTNSAGQLVLSALTDAGVILKSFTFNRDGTIDVPGVDFFATGATTAGIITSASVMVFPTVVTGNSGTWYNTGNGRFTPPAGRYFIYSQLGWYSSSAVIGIEVVIRKNGTNIASLYNFATTGGANLHAIALAQGHVDANGTDYFDVTGRSSNVTPSGSFVPLNFGAYRL